MFGIGIGIQRPRKYWGWDCDWERGNLYKMFGIGLGIGILSAYNSEIGIKPCKVNRSNKYSYTQKNVKQHHLFQFVVHTRRSKQERK